MSAADAGATTGTDASGLALIVGTMTATRRSAGHRAGTAGTGCCGRGRYEHHYPVYHRQRQGDDPPALGIEPEPDQPAHALSIAVQLRARAWSV